VKSTLTLMNMFRRIFVFIRYLWFVCPFTEVLQEIRRDITRKVWILVWSTTNGHEFTLTTSLEKNESLCEAPPSQTNIWVKLWRVVLFAAFSSLHAWVVAALLVVPGFAQSYGGKAAAAGVDDPGHELPFTLHY
jgi:hypothetical protein